MENYHKLGILQKYLGDYKPKKGTDYAFRCPFCRHPKYKLEIDITAEIWNCWVCHTSGGGIGNLLRKLKASPSDINVFSKFKPDRTNEGVNEARKEQITYPFGFTPLSSAKDSYHVEAAKAYLFQRGVSSDDIIEYNIGIITSGKNAGNLIIPSYDKNGHLNYYIEKNIVSGRYNNIEAKKRDIAFFDFFINWDLPVILVEGSFDAMAVQLNACPLLGKDLLPGVKMRILHGKAPYHYAALDGGEETANAKLAESIYALGKGVKVVKFPLNSDPSSLGKQEVWKYINEATEWGPDSNFEEAFLTKLATLI